MRKVALITGGAKRLGAFLSLNLAEKGYDIILHCNKSFNEALQLRKTIVDQGGVCDVLQADLSKPQDLDSLIDKITSQYDHVDLLINNASSFLFDSIDSISPYQLDHQLHIIFKSNVFLLKNIFCRQKKGHVINILDSMSLQSAAKQKLSYWLCKKSCENLTKISAISLAPHVRVNAISPGFILEPAHGDRTKEESHRKAASFPLQRKGDPCDILQAILSLELLTFTTGQILFVDGGKHLLNHT